MPRFYITYWRGTVEPEDRYGEFIISADSAQEAINTIVERCREDWNQPFFIRAIYTFDEIKGVDLNAM